ncbi:MAG TPA: TolC family protein [Vicinamibacterales bacterium]|nr:TolC family protein [Vicinamibacterales bacterium]
MRASRWGAALLAVCLPAGARAQSVPLTEAEALARLSEESPRVRAQRAVVDVARADVLVAGRWPNPRVAFDRESVAGVTEDIVTVSQPLPVTGRRGLEVAAASTLVDAAERRADDGVRRIRADLRLAFAQLVAAQERERQLQRARGRLQDVARILERREAAGDISGFDRLRAEAELFDLEADEAIAATDRARAQAALAAFFDGADAGALVAGSPARVNGDVPPLDALIARATSTRGEVSAINHEREAARLSGQAAARRRFPEPEVMGGTKSSSVGGDAGSVVAVQATLPLFDRGRPERAVADARQRLAAARAESFTLALRSELTALRETVIRRRASADRYRETAIRGIDRIERIASVSYEAGERGILELLDAYRIGIAAATRQVSLDLAARQAEIELEFVSGWEMP